MEWFKTINIAGEKLADQELRNAVYSGSWVTVATPSRHIFQGIAKRLCRRLPVGQ